MTQREIIGKTPHTMRLLLAIALAIIMIAGGFVALASSQPTATSPTATAAATTASILPNPTLNTNISWSSFNSSWGELEYFNGTSQANLTASPNPAVANPISIDTADIQSSQLETFANWTKNIGIDPASGGQVKTLTNSSTSVTETVNTTAAQSTVNEVTLHIPIQKIPSTNLNFTYITIAYSISGANLTGEQAYLALWNTTQVSTLAANSTIYGSGTVYKSISLWQIIKNGIPKITMNYDTGTYITMGIYQNLPAAISSTYTLQITALDLTTYPIILGQNSTGSQINNAIGNAALSIFKPTVPMTVTNGGYSVAVSQNLQNTIESQSAISGGNYIEQVTYQGTLSLPPAPDLTYINSVIQMNLTTPGSQYEVANLNGISYLTTLQTKNNGTFVFATVNPNQQNSVILQVDYTTAQWNSVSGAPPFFSLAGLEYYWWVGLIGFFSLIGLGSAALAHWGGEEENLRTPKGKFGR